MTQPRERCGKEGFKRARLRLELTSASVPLADVTAGPYDVRPANGRELHAEAPALPAQNGDRSLGDDDGPERVDFDLSAERTEAPVFDRSEIALAGIVHENIEAAERLLGKANGRLRSGLTVTWSFAIRSLSPTRSRSGRSGFGSRAEATT